MCFYVFLPLKFNPVFIFYFFIFLHIFKIYFLHFYFSNVPLLLFFCSSYTALYFCHTLRSWLHEIVILFRSFSPRLGHNDTLKWWYENFPYITHMSPCMEYCQNYNWVCNAKNFCCSNYILKYFLLLYFSSALFSYS